QAPCAPNPSRAPHRSAGLSDQEALPCRDQTHKRIGPVHHLAVPSSTAPANHRLNPTESRFAHRLNDRFATQSGVKRTAGEAVASFDPTLLTQSGQTLRDCVTAIEGVVPFTSSRRRSIASCKTSPLRLRGISSPPSK